MSRLILPGQQPVVAKSVEDATRPQVLHPAQLVPALVQAGVERLIEFGWQEGKGRVLIKMSCGPIVIPMEFEARAGEEGARQVRRGGEEGDAGSGTHAGTGSPDLHRGYR